MRDGRICVVAANVRAAASRRTQSAIDHGHHHFGVAGTGSDAFRGDFVDAAKIVGREFHVERSNIFFEIFATLGAGDRNDVLALRKEPCKSELRRRAVFFAGDGFDARHQIEVLVEIFSLETR
jgi:hypothetical protein